MLDWNEVQYFEKREWQKSPDKAAPQLVVTADQIRGIMQVPAIVHVCWDDDGHTEHSYHYTGQAVDFHFEDRGQTFWEELLAILSGIAIRGIGFYPDWDPRPGWHIDIRLDLPRVFWCRKAGEYHYGVDEIVGAIQANNIWEAKK